MVGPTRRGFFGVIVSALLASLSFADSGDAPVGDAEVITTSATKTWEDEVQRDMNPANDGWDSELFSERANKQLKRLGTLMLRGEAVSAKELASLLTADFNCTALRPKVREEVFADNSVTVERAAGIFPNPQFNGAEGLVAAIDHLTAGFGDASRKYFKFKLFRIAPNDRQIDTTCYFDVSGRTAAGSIQRTATWLIRWESDAENQEPRIESISVEDYEEAVVRNAKQTLFTDVASGVFRDERIYAQQFLRGIDSWRSSLEAYLGIYFDGLHGLAIGDANGDGLDDLYVCEPGGLPNRLFVQRPDGTVKDVSAQSGVDLLDATRSALLVDLDNDGDQDLVIPVERQVHFFENNGHGRFSPKLTIPIAGPTAYFLTSADYDQDGRLDIYAGSYFGLDDEESNRLPAPLPLHDSRTGGKNRLLRNQGDWEFVDVTEEAGLDHNNDRWSFAAVWEDYDNDGDQDLYVANDFGRNNLYRNDDGKFSDVAGPAYAEDMSFGMSATFGDFNRDGWMDLYVSNMFSAAGGRITFQPGFQTKGSDQLKAAYQRMARGNTLLTNRGDGTFRDVSEDAGVTMGRWAWGSLFADVNNDGWEDLLVANGFVTGHLPGDL